MENITTKIRKSTHADLSQMANEYGLSLVQAVDVVIAAFNGLPDGKKFKTIKAAAKNRKTRKRTDS